MASPNLSEIVTTTLRHRSKRIANNVSKSNALLERLNQRGRVRTVSGGRDIVQELDYAENSTFKYYSGYEILDISPSDVLSASTWPFKQAAVAVTFSGLEADIQNSGPEAVINLVRARIDNAERTMKNNLSIGIYSDGTGSAGKQITGLQAIVSDAPATGIVGGIDRAVATNAFWRNFVFDATTDGGLATDAGNIKGYMQTVYTNLMRGNDKPDLLVADADYFQKYWESLTDIQRISRVDQGESGFQSLKFASADFIYDGDSGIPAQHMYFLNTDYIFWRPHASRNMVPLEQRNSINQDATVVLLVFAGNMTCSNASLQGVMKE